MEIYSSAPTRLDLAGGTLDIWPLYLFHEGAQTLNAAITLRSECTLSSNNSEGILIVSKDTGLSIKVDHWSMLGTQKELKLVTNILRFFKVNHLKVTTNSSAPLGAGLAGSSALNVALCGALAQWQQQSYTSDELISLALNLEAQVLGIPTGVQDYRPAMYGGLAAIELNPTGVRRKQLTLNPHELEKRIVLSYTGQSRNSGINNWKITKEHLDGNQEVIDLLEKIRDVTAVMRQALENQDWIEVGRQLSAEWLLRKRLSPKVSTPRIDLLIEHAHNAGASGAKVCGAGGGGCVIFLTEPSCKTKVRNALIKAGAQVLDFKIDNDGLKIKTTNGF